MIIGVDIRVLMDKQYSGVSQYAANLLAALLEIDKENQYRLFYNSWQNLSDKMKVWQRPNVEIIASPYPNKVFNYGLQGFLGRPYLDRLIGGCDVFFSPHINFSNFSSHSKQVLTIHDLSFLRYPEFFSWRKNLWHQALNLKKLASQADVLVAVSENTRQDIIDLLKVEASKVRVIHSGFKAPLGSTDIASAQSFITSHGLQAGYILYLGNLEPRKNIVGLIEAYEIFRRHNLDSAQQLILAGADAWKTKAIRLAWQKSPYRDDIKLLGYVSEAEKAYLYSTAGLFVYPSFYEGFGFPPLEAMSYGLPVLCSNSSSLPEIVAQGALMVNPYDLNNLAKGMELILKDASLMEQLKSRAFKRTANFNWQDSANKYLELFTSLSLNS